MDNSGTLVALNSLIEINNDRIEGYNTALNETKDEELKTLFEQFAETSKNFNLELKAQVALLNGETLNQTSTIGKFFRAWMEVKTAITNHDTKAILQSCIYGEELAMEAYNNALSRDIHSLTPELQTIIKKQRELLKMDEKIITMMLEELELMQKETQKEI